LFIAKFPSKAIVEIKEVLAAYQLELGMSVKERAAPAISAARVSFIE
jgi:hypothetical protein